MATENALQLLEELRGMTTFDGERVLPILTAIAGVRFDKSLSAAQKTEFYEAITQRGFPEMAVKMKMWFNSVGVFRNEETWQTYRKLTAILWNTTDGHYAFALKLLQAGYLRLSVADLNHENYKTMRAQHAQVRYVLRSNMGIIHNCSRVQELRDVFTQEGVIEAVTPYCTTDEPGIKAISYMILAVLMREDDAGGEKVVAADDVIGLLVAWLKGALDSPKRLAGGGEFSGGFSPLELTVVIKKLAAEDRSKKKFMEADVVASLKRMIADDGHKEEQQLAAETIANLAFDNEIRAKLKQDSELMHALDKLLQSTDDHMKRAVSGALWILNESSKHVKVSADGDASATSKKDDGHIMISYSWADQKTMLLARDKLKGAGHVVWMDVDSMTGSTLQAMAEAVEKAKLVIMCCSEGYKKSPNCRIEAEYAFQCQKLVLPLMMQRGYKPDGWLGIMVGPKLFVDFSGKYPFEKSWENLQLQLKHYLQGQVVDHASHHAESAGSVGQASQTSNAPGFAKWTHEKVKSWLKDNKLEKYAESFNEVDGTDLEQIQIMHKTAPEAYYKALQESLRLSLWDGLRFTRSLSALS